MSKSHYTCSAFTRGNPSAGCRQKIRCSRFDSKTLQKAGWRPSGTLRKDIWNCPACLPPKPRKLTNGEKTLRKSRFDRGRSDAALDLPRVSTHSDYLRGYKEGLHLCMRERHV